MFTQEIDYKSEQERLMIISLKGFLDSKYALDFYEYATGQESKYSRYIFNCKDLEGISSLGFSVILRIRKKFIQKEYIPIFTDLNNEIHEIFHFLGFNKLFYITKNINLAKNILLSLHPLSSESSIEDEVQEKINISIPEVSTTTQNSLDKDEPISDLSIESLKEDEDVYVPVFLSEAKIPSVNQTNISNSESTDKPNFLSELRKKNYEFSIPFITKTGSEIKEKILDSIIIEEENRGYNQKFTELIINCGNCGTKIRITKQGKQKCPTCNASFLLRQSGSISTIEKI